jgi:soluble lytic murein transglycosylase-like protein
MRLGMWGAALLAGLVVGAPTANADIYLHRDQLGVLHFTNAPAGPSRMVIKERPLPPARRLFSLRGGFPVMAPGPVAKASATSYDDLIHEIADRYEVEYALVKAVIKAESDFDRLAVSPKGALGLMQLMPATAAMHRVRNVFLPRDNIEGGVRHLRMLLNRYGGNVTLSVAAYNAGTQRVEDAGGVPPITETREYVGRVLRYRLAYLREDTRVVQARR